MPSFAPLPDPIKQDAAAPKQFAPLPKPKTPPSPESFVRRAASTVGDYAKGLASSLGDTAQGVTQLTYNQMVPGLGDLLAKQEGRFKPNVPDSLAGRMGKATGDIGQFFAVPEMDVGKAFMLGPKAAKAAELAVQGGIIGGVTPAKDAKERAENVVSSAALSAVGGTLLPAMAGLAKKGANYLNEGAKGAFALLQHSAPARMAIERLGALASARGESIEEFARKLVKNGREVPNVPTVAQAAPSTEALQREISLRAKPATQLAHNKAAVANDAKHMDLIAKNAAETVDGKPTGERERLDATRKAHFAAMDQKMAVTPVATAPLLKKLRDVTVNLGGDPAVKGAVQTIIGNIEGRMNANISDAIARGAPPRLAAVSRWFVTAKFLNEQRRAAYRVLQSALGGSRPNGAQVKAMSRATDEIESVLKSRVPGFEAANKLYAKESERINDIDAWRQLSRDTRKLVPNAGIGDKTFGNHVTLKNVQRAISHDDSNWYKMTPASRKELEGLEAVVKRRGISEQTSGVRGANTMNVSELGKALRSPWVQRIIGIEAYSALAGAAAGGQHSGDKGALAGGLGAMVVGGALAHKANAAETASLVKEAELMANSSKASRSLRALEKIKAAQAAKPPTKSQIIADALKRAKAKAPLPTGRKAAAAAALTAGQELTGDDSD